MDAGVERLVAEDLGARQRVVARGPFLRWRRRDAVAIFEAPEGDDADADEGHAKQRPFHNGWGSKPYARPGPKERATTD